jgi:nitrite reductase/ring-hydroxylating ferredoxin subunit
MSERFHKVVRASAMVDEDLRAIEVEGVPMLLARCRGRFFATQRHCPHQGNPLEDGLVSGDGVLCPVHGWRFDLASGQHDSSPACLTTYPVRVVGDDVEVAAAPRPRAVSTPPDDPTGDAR